MTIDQARTQILTLGSLCNRWKWDDTTLEQQRLFREAEEALNEAAMALYFVEYEYAKERQRKQETAE